MSWDLKNDRPIWMQLSEILTRRIVSGMYPPGIRLPSVRELAAEAGVNPNTMQRALAGLEESALVSAQRSTGRFVTQDAEQIAATRQALAEAELALFRKRMAQLGFGEEALAQFITALGQNAAPPPRGTVETYDKPEEEAP